MIPLQNKYIIDQELFPYDNDSSNVIIPDILQWVSETKINIWVQGYTQKGGNVSEFLTEVKIQDFSFSLYLSIVDEHFVFENTDDEILFKLMWS